MTNKGAIIGSLVEPLEIDVKKLVVENLKDHDNGESYNVGFSGVDRKNLIPETALQYESHDKEQDTNATFANTVIRENSKEINLEERGINTDIEKAQVMTKDEVVDPIDTVLHTDLLNKDKRENLKNDLSQFFSNIESIKGIAEISRNKNEKIENYLSRVEDELNNGKIVVIEKGNLFDKTLINSYNKDDRILYDAEDQIYAKDLSGKAKFQPIEEVELYTKDGKKYNGMNGQVLYNLEAVLLDSSQQSKKTAKDENLEYDWAVKAIEVKDNKGKKITVYEYTPLIQAKETSASAPILISFNTAKSTGKPMALSHDHGDEYRDDNSEYFSTGDMNTAKEFNLPVSMVTPTGKVFVYNPDGQIHYLGTVDTTKGFDSKYFEVKKNVRLTYKEIKVDANYMPVKDKKNRYIYEEKELITKVIFPK